MPGSITAKHFYRRTFTDTCNVTDSKGLKPKMVYSDTVNLTDSETNKVGQLHSETINLTDSIARVIGALRTDTCNITDTFLRNWTLARAYTDTLNITDTLDRKRFYYFADTCNVSDSHSILFGLNRTETLNITDVKTQNWTLARTYTDTLNPIDDMHRLKYNKGISDFATDFANVLADDLDETATLSQTTLTTDSIGNITGASTTSVSIEGYFTSTSLRDRRVMAPGIPIAGLLTGYFKPEYTVAGNDYTVTQGNLIIRDSITWRVITVEEVQRLGTTEIYLKAIMRSE